jgi:hypothetical protein
LPDVQKCTLKIVAFGTIFACAGMKKNLKNNLLSRISVILLNCQGNETEKKMRTIRKETKAIKETLKTHTGCVLCGYKGRAKHFDFAHKPNTDKAANPADIRDSKRKLFAELHKCVVLCKHCHIDTDDGLIDWADIFSQKKYNQYNKMLNKLEGK